MIINVKSNYLSFKAGILEQMFTGIGVEYLNLDQFDNFAFGFEAFQVKKRDYDQKFGHLLAKPKTLSQTIG